MKFNLVVNMVLMMVIMTWWSRRCFHQSPSSRLLFCVNTLIGAWWGYLGGRTPHLLFITMRTISGPTIDEGLWNYLYDNSGYFISLFNFINSSAPEPKGPTNQYRKKDYIVCIFYIPSLLHRDNLKMLWTLLLAPILLSMEVKLMPHCPKDLD